MAFGDNFWGTGTIDPNVGLRDYQHAARVFVDNYYQLVPKHKHLYSVLVRPNPSVMKNINELKQNSSNNGFGNNILGQIQGVLNTITDVMNTPNRLLNNLFGDPSEGIRVRQLGTLAKHVDLPKFTLISDEKNQYNKKVPVFTGIKYDPVTIVFHDDSNNTVINLWNNYYKYFYGDPNVPRKTGYAPDVIKDVRNYNNWGFQTRTLKDFFLAIDFYNFSKGMFTMHSIMNPWIMSMQSGEMEAASADPRDISITFGYSGVLYATGYIQKGTPPGFADLIYDKTPSPLTNKVPNNNNIFNANTGGLFTGPQFNQQITNPLGGAVTSLPIIGAGIAAVGIGSAFFSGSSGGGNAPSSPPSTPTSE